MKQSIGRHFTYANVIASIALFTALGGGAYAAGNAMIAHDGKIMGCVYPKYNGDLHIAAVGKRCAKGAIPLPFNARGPSGAPGLNGKQGSQGIEGPKGPTGPKGPEGVSGETRYGNVLVAPGAAEVLLAEVGAFQFWGRCSEGGYAETIKKTTTEGNSIYDEDGEYRGNFDVGVEVDGDEDYDEAGFERDNTTGLTLQYNLYMFSVTEASTTDCEFQGVITRTS